jgi:ribosomal protein S25
MSKDFVFASLFQDTSNDSFLIQEEIIKPRISNEIKKEETLTPQNLVEQYKLELRQYLEVDTRFENQEVEQILEEHSYCKKIGIR